MNNSGEYCGYSPVLYARRVAKMGNQKRIPVRDIQLVDSQKWISVSVIQESSGYSLTATQAMTGHLIRGFGQSQFIPYIKNAESGRLNLLHQA